MKKRTFNIISGIITAVVGGATVVIRELQPAEAVAIIGAIGVAGNAIIAILSKFVKEEEKKEE